MNHERIESSDFNTLVSEFIPEGIRLLRSADGSRDNEVDFYLYPRNPDGKRNLERERVLLSNLDPEKSAIQIWRTLKNANTCGEAGLVEVFYKKNGEPCWLNIFFVPQDGSIYSHTVDVSANKKAENDGKLKAEKAINELNKSLVIRNRLLESLNSELSTFNAIAANNYKETLAHLYTNLEYLVSNDAANLSNTGKANIRRAQSAIQKMKLLTDDIIQYSGFQIGETDFTTINLDEIIRTVEKDLRNKIPGFTAVIECDDMPEIPGNSHLIYILFYHLLDNAVKFSKPQTKLSIHISCSQVSGTAINYASASATTMYHVISVADNGIGFDPSLKDKIFTMFFRIHPRNKYKGSGTGLAICRKIMDLHGGFINATSDGDGSSFDCYFPVESTTSLNHEQP